MIYSRAIALRIFTHKLRLAKLPDAERDGMLLYSFGQASFAVVFRFGVVVFWNVPLVQQQHFLAEMMVYTKIPLEVQYTEEYQLSINKKDDIGYNKISVQKLELTDAISMSFVFAQSTVLARLETEADEQLYHLNRILRPIEKYGKITMRRKQLLKQLGQVLRDRTHAFYEFGFDNAPADASNDDRRQRIHAELKMQLDITGRIAQVNAKWDTVTEEMQFLFSLITEREDLHIELILVFFALIVDILLTLWEILA
ncbi:MAG: RMD1 family protein [Candidatus Kerfeldbacteria bacterium]|nr:RMD1 family protein [Candidatus Kerfeldbacteria bacterium]